MTKTKKPLTLTSPFPPVPPLSTPLILTPPSQQFPPLLLALNKNLSLPLLLIKQPLFERRKKKHFTQPQSATHLYPIVSPEPLPPSTQSHQYSPLPTFPNPSTPHPPLMPPEIHRSTSLYPSLDPLNTPDEKEGSALLRKASETQEYLGP